MRQHSHLKLARDLVGALNRHDRDRVDSLVAPEAGWPLLIWLDAEFEEFQVELDEIVPAGCDLLVPLWIRGRDRISGLQLRQFVVAACRIRGGRVVAVSHHGTIADALASLERPAAAAPAPVALAA